MTKEEFSTQILDMKRTLYRVSCGILRSETDREDAVQECICKAWEKKDSLKDAGAFRAWVTRILINECYDICRRNSRIIVLDELPERASPGGPEPGGAPGHSGVRPPVPAAYLPVLHRRVQHPRDISDPPGTGGNGKIPAVCRTKQA